MDHTKLEDIEFAFFTTPFQPLLIQTKSRGKEINGGGIRGLVTDHLLKEGGWWHSD